MVNVRDDSMRRITGEKEKIYHTNYVKLDSDPGYRRQQRDQAGKGKIFIGERKHLRNGFSLREE